MKKLFKSFIPVLAMFSLLISSCEKEKPAAPQKVFDVKGVFDIDYSYRTIHAPHQSGTGTGDIGMGITAANYQLSLDQQAVKCPDGKWYYFIGAKPKTAVFASSQDPKTGIVTFVAGTKSAVYTITIVYTCPDGKSYLGQIKIET
jgi:hypothetical protein